ncbi:MAG: peptidoglycan DD-metalloendopeptidase family protein [bacterium]|nr:peptidoglycan DD-metalloendopeptidase family protein [bacterium]
MGYKISCLKTKGGELKELLSQGIQILTTIPKRFRIMVMPEGSAHMKQFTFRMKHLALGAIGGSIFFALVIALSAYLLGTWVAERRIASVMQEQHQLQSQVVTLSQRLSNLKQKLTDLAHTDNLLRQGLGLPIVNEEARSAGVGGVVSSEKNGNDPNADALAEDIAELEREIALQKESFTEIQVGIQHQAEIVTHTPSIRPISGGYIGSGYGYRNDPFTGKRKEHEGLDINAPIGTPIYATAPGVVKVARYLTAYGNVLVIDHIYGYQTVYAHMNNFAARVGDKVKRGDIIGYVGRTGRASGPHVHYEVRLHTRPIDPMDFLFDTFAEAKR